MIGDARLVPTWPSAGWLLTLALSSQVVGWLLIATSLPRLPAAMTSMLLTVQPVGSVALAALILGESPSPLQLVGVLFILAALGVGAVAGSFLLTQLRTRLSANRLLVAASLVYALVMVAIVLIPNGIVAEMQINITVPANAPLGQQPLVVSVGGVPSQTVMVTVNAGQ